MLYFEEKSILTLTQLHNISQRNPTLKPVDNKCLSALNTYIIKRIKV